ncbi:hypothetical protein [Vibrio sp. HN007]|uniref:hypothetical protein n=1 Tax=Vibrio iocasae TaxID=3098914 RepID=UPI0035D52664
MSIFKLSIREKLDRLTKTQLINFRQEIFDGKHRSLGAEGEVELLRLIETRINKDRRGRPRKNEADRCSKQIKINVTPAEQAELKARMENLGYTKLSTYMRDMTLNLTPELRVKTIERPAHDEELLESINEDIQFMSLQLMHAVQGEVLGLEAAQEIIRHLSSVQQSIIEREQRELNEYNADFALLLANQLLSKEQLEMLLNFKESKEAAQHY